MRWLFLSPRRRHRLGCGYGSFAVAGAAATRAALAAAAAVVAALLLLGCSLFAPGSEAFDPPRINPNLVLMFGISSELHATLAASGAVTRRFFLFSGADVLYRKKRVGLQMQPEKYWKCTTGNWFLRVRLNDPGPVESLEPYPLAASIEYVDEATNGVSPMPSLLSLEPLNPINFASFVLRQEGKTLKGWRGTLACVEKGQPLQLFTGWPMQVSTFPSGSWRCEVSLLASQVNEPTWDPSASSEPSFASLKKKDSILIHIIFKTLAAATPLQKDKKTLPAEGRQEEAALGDESPRTSLGEAPGQGPPGGQVLTLMSLAENRHTESFLSKSEWLEELRRQLEAVKVCVLYSSKEGVAKRHMAAAEGSEEWVQETEEETHLHEEPEVEMELPAWTASRGDSQQREKYVVWLKCPQLPPIVNSPFENVLRSVSPSFRHIARETLRPYKRWQTPALMSAAFFLLSSLLLWRTGDTLSKLGVPAHRIPKRPLDVRRHVRYAEGLARSNEQWVSNVFAQSPAVASFGRDGQYYETPTAPDSLSRGEHARVVGGSVLSSLGLAAAVVTGAGALGTTLKGVLNAGLRKGKLAATKLLHRLPWHRASNNIVDSVAHRLLQEQAEGGGKRQVLLMVFDNNPTEANIRNLQREESKGSRDVAKWLQRRLAAQVVLPPLDVFKKPFLSSYLTATNTRANLPVSDFLRGLLLPHCRAEVEKRPELLTLFSLSVATPLSQSSKRSAASSSSQDSGASGEKVGRFGVLLSPSLPMRHAVDLLNAYRGAHLVVSVGPPAGSDSGEEEALEDSVSANEEALEVSVVATDRQAETRIWQAVGRHCLLFRKKPPVNMAGASISLRLNLALPPSFPSGCEWPGASQGALMVQHIPPATTAKELVDRLLSAFRSGGLLPPREPAGTETEGDSAAVAAAAAAEAAADANAAADAAAKEGRQEDSPSSSSAAAAAAADAAEGEAAAANAGVITLPEGLTELALGLFTTPCLLGDDRTLSPGPCSASRVSLFRLHTSADGDKDKETVEAILERVPFMSSVRQMLYEHGYDGIYFGFVYLPHSSSQDAGEDGEESGSSSSSSKAYVHPFSKGLALLSGAVYNFATDTLSLHSQGGPCTPSPINAFDAACVLLGSTAETR